MSNVIAHIIGLDEIHKRKLLIKLLPIMKIIDLDSLQQTIHNCEDIVMIKNIWANTTDQIIFLRKKMLSCKKNVPVSLKKQIDELISFRNQTRKNMYIVWKDKMSTEISDLLQKYHDHKIALIGFNVHPKDYRIKINLPDIENKYVYDIESTDFASNQIKYYLNTFSNQIIKGSFPINLLKHDYVSTKHKKLTNFFYKQGYQSIHHNSLYTMMKKLATSKYIDIVTHEDLLFVPSIYKTGDTILADVKNPIIGYETYDDAKQAIMPKSVKNQPIYIYQVPLKQFEHINNQYVSTKILYPVDEDSVLLSSL